MVRPRRFPCLAVAVALTAAFAFSACGDDSSSEVPDDAVAVIGDTEISTDQLDERVAALRRAQPKPTKQQRQLIANDRTVRAQAEQQLKDQALSTLLQAQALEQEAADRDIEVDEADVRARWNAIASKQFRTKRALRTFLGGQTEDEIIEQLRLQTLAERIDAQVAEQAGGGKKGEQAVKRFREEFRTRWQDDTTCRDGIDAAGCPPADTNTDTTK